MHGISSLVGQHSPPWCPVNLTGKRQLLGERAFHHLLTKEVGRAVVLGYLCIGGLCFVPPMVHARRLSVGRGSFLTLFSFYLANCTYGILLRSIIMLFQLGGGETAHGTHLIEHCGKIDDTCTSENMSPAHLNRHHLHLCSYKPLYMWPP